ncbi:MAG: DUF1829 domain-containing protein [Armatimonadetes bacterium]|nr:DUF1829 domain-containing protein [Armatimonadota bacterium]
MDQYLAWLRDKTALREVGDHVEVTTPYLDRHNDYLQLYISRSNGGYSLTDDGYILADLKQSGCGLDTKKRQDLLKMTLNGFGVRLEDEALTVHATPDNFNLRKHSLVQAMLAVNDLFCLAQPTVISLFHEDVTAWLDLNEVRYTRNPFFKGKSGYDHVFDYVIPKSRRAPERIVRAISRPNKEAAQAYAFAWIDTRETRLEGSKAFAILNDADHEPSAAVVDALRTYEVTPVPWSRRDEARDELVA